MYYLHFFTVETNYISSEWSASTDVNIEKIVDPCGDVVQYKLTANQPFYVDLVTTLQFGEHAEDEFRRITSFSQKLFDLSDYRPTTTFLGTFEEYHRLVITEWLRTQSRWAEGAMRAANNFPARVNASEDYMDGYYELLFIKQALDPLNRVEF